MTYITSYNTVTHAYGNDTPTQLQTLTHLLGYSDSTLGNCKILMPWRNSFTILDKSESALISEESIWVSDTLNKTKH